MKRRGFLLGAAALACSGKSLSAAELAPPYKQLAFNVVRNDTLIGTHVLDFSGAGGDLVVSVSVELVVRFGPIPLYRYTHQAREEWQGGKVMSVEANTTDGGDKFKLIAKRVDSALDVDGANGKYRAPENTLAATHWNKRMLDGPMINTQDGMLMRPGIENLGIQPVALASGETIQANRYRLSGDARLDTWYDASARWVGILFVGRDGSEIKYVLA